MLNNDLHLCSFKSHLSVLVFGDEHFQTFRFLGQYEEIFKTLFHDYPTELSNRNSEIYI